MAPPTGADDVRRDDSEHGFTLIELLIVVVIIGILAAIVIARYNDVRLRALRVTLSSDLRSMSAWQELHHMRNQTYGATPAEINAELSEGVTVTITEADGIGWSATATHTGTGDGQCAFYYGRADPVPPATTPGVVACDF